MVARETSSRRRHSSTGDSSAYANEKSWVRVSLPSGGRHTIARMARRRRVSSRSEHRYTGTDPGSTRTWPVLSGFERPASGGSTTRLVRSRSGPSMDSLDQASSPAGPNIATQLEPRQRSEEHTSELQSPDHLV